MKEGMKITLIGCGNMGSAILSGLIKSGVKPDCITAADASAAARERAAEKFGIMTSDDNAAAAKDADVILLAVKPQYLKPVLADVRNVIRPEQLVLSIVAGVHIAALREGLGGHEKIVRAMPNTPALIGKGITGFSPAPAVTAEEKETAAAILHSLGMAEELPEHLLDAVTAVSGSGPAHVFLFIEAMADAAVLEGMPRDQAYRFAAAAVEGSAAMVLESGEHPGVLKDRVTSPAGTTIEALRILEQGAFRGTVIEAVHACAERSRELG